MKTTKDYLLAVESSCDETAASVVKGERRIISSVVSSQIDIHACFGGVVPELASRHHIVNIVPVIREALNRASSLDKDFQGFSSLKGIAVSSGPGLVGSLMMGLQTVKGMCLATGLPLVGINHLEAHLEAIYAVEIESTEELNGDLPPKIQCPYVALLVSGGHTLLINVKERGIYSIVGGTRDDAAGEAYDKVAKMLGLGYPGGVIIDKLAKGGNPRAIHFPRALPGRKQRDFSFSGLKTAVRRHLQQNGVPKRGTELNDLCASFQEAVVEVLIQKAVFAMEDEKAATLVLAGGVAANSRLRERAAQLVEERGWRVAFPPLSLCTDNAAMVAVAGARKFNEGRFSDLSLDAVCRSLPGNDM